MVVARFEFRKSLHEISGDSVFVLFVLSGFVVLVVLLGVRRRWKWEGDWVRMMEFDGK